jgi:hypothetical protein
MYRRSLVADTNVFCKTVGVNIRSSNGTWRRRMRVLMMNVGRVLENDSNRNQYLMTERSLKQKQRQVSLMTDYVSDPGFRTPTDVTYFSGWWWISLMSNETNSWKTFWYRYDFLFASGTLHEVLPHRSNTDVFNLGWTQIVSQICVIISHSGKMKGKTKLLADWRRNEWLAVQSAEISRYVCVQRRVFCGRNIECTEVEYTGM